MVLAGLAGREDGTGDQSPDLFFVGSDGSSLGGIGGPL